MDTDPMVSRPEIGMQTQLLYHKGCVSIRYCAKKPACPLCPCVGVPISRLLTMG